MTEDPTVWAGPDRGMHLIRALPDRGIHFPGQTGVEECTFRYRLPDRGIHFHGLRPEQSFALKNDEFR